MKISFQPSAPTKSEDSPRRRTRDPSLRLKNGCAQDDAVNVWPKIPARSRRVSQRPTTASRKLLQKPHVPLKEQLQIIHAIFQQSQPVDAHAESESRNPLRVVPVVLYKLKHVRIDHAATQHLNPSRLLARTAWIGTALPASAADEAGHIQL